MSAEDFLLEQAAFLRAQADFGVYVGRLSPMHLGHQFQVRLLVEAFGPNHLIVLGSCGKSISLRHLFSYVDRRNFIHVIEPRARIVGLADFSCDLNWFQALDDLIELAGADPKKCVYIGGSQGDTEFYEPTGRSVFLINRYAGFTVNVSGEEVRDSLLERRPLTGLVDDRLIPLVLERFELRRAELKKQ